MALIREILQNSDTQMWAFIETSDENSNHFIILGDKEFPTEKEAKEWSEGFTLDSYVWKDPIDFKKEQIRHLFKEIIDTKNRLDELVKYLEDREISCNDLMEELENLIS